MLSGPSHDACGTLCGLLDTGSLHLCRSWHRCSCHPMPQANMDVQLRSLRGDIDRQGCCNVSESSPSPLLGKLGFQLTVQLNAVLVPTTGMPDGSPHTIFNVWVAVLWIVLHDRRLLGHCTG